MAEPLPFVVAVIEDDDNLRALLCVALKREGFAVLEAWTLEQAERLLLEYPWDLAVLDRHLPDGDALTLCERVRLRDAAFPRYVLMLSADASADSKRRGFDSGVDDYVAKPADIAELTARIRAARRIVEYQKQLLGRMEVLEQMSILDAVTHVYNRRFLEVELTRSVSLALRYGRALSVAMIDIDHFKDTNDHFGHAVGDRVLVELSTLMVQNLRSPDVVARYGGEEFALVLPETALPEAVVIIERLRETVESTSISTTSGEVHITISAGVASLPFTENISPAALLEAADRSLYRAKSEGRNRVVASMDAEIGTGIQPALGGNAPSEESG